MLDMGYIGWHDHADDLMAHPAKRKRPGDDTPSRSQNPFHPSRKAHPWTRVHQSPDNPPDPQAATPYFPRRAVFAAEVRAEVARRVRTLAA